MIKFIKDNKGKIIIPFLISFIYLFMVLFADIIKKADSYLTIGLNALVILIISAIVSFLFIYFFYNKKIKIEESNNNKKIMISFIISSILIFLILLVYIVAYSPGSFSPDSINQYTQAVTEEYNDWHPYIHTLLIFKLPIAIFGNATSIIVMQMVYFSLAVGYLIKTLVKYNIPIKYVILTFILFAVNTDLGLLLMKPWKDIALLIFSLILTTQFANIYFSKGKWLEKKINIILLGFVFVITTLVRHNAILFTAPLIIIMLLFYPKQKVKIGIVSLIFIIGVFLANVPLANYLKVAEPENRTTETVGLPMSIISSVVHTKPDNLGQEVYEFAYSISPEGKYDTYIHDGWNQIKFTGVNTDVIEDEGVVNVLNYTYQSFKANPSIAIKGMLEVTDVVWDPYIKYEVMYELEENELGIEMQHNENAKKIIENLSKAIENISKIVNVELLFNSIGFITLIMLLAACTRITNFLEKILLLLPIICYNFGTMMLLTGGDTRFFAYTIVIFPLILIMIMSEKRTELDKRVKLIYLKYENILKQIGSFIIISGIGWLLDMLVFSILQSTFNFNQGLSNFISSFIGVSYVYILSVRKTFRISKDKSNFKYIVYIIYQFIIISLNSVIITFLSQMPLFKDFEYGSIIAKILTTPLTITVNFVFMKWLMEKIQFGKQMKDKN